MWVWSQHGTACWCARCFFSGFFCFCRKIVFLASSLSVIWFLLIHTSYPETIKTAEKNQLTIQDRYKVIGCECHSGQHPDMTMAVDLDGKTQLKQTHTRFLSGKNIIVRLIEFRQYFSCPMGKPTICIDENKGADQLLGNREADQRLCFRYSDSTIPPLLNSISFQASSLLLCLYRSVCVGPVRKPHCLFFHEVAHLGENLAVQTLHN